MQPHDRGGSGHQMNSSQLQEMQRLLEMQTRLRQQQQQQRQSSQGAPMMQQQPHQRLMMGQQQQQQQQQGHRNPLAGLDDATLLLLQQGLGGRRMSGGSSVTNPSVTSSAQQAALYMNAMQAKNIAERQNSIGSQSSASSMGGMTGMNPPSSNRNSSATASSLQALLMQQQQQQQHQSLGSASLLMGGGTQPQLAAATTSEQLLMQQQRMMADIKRQLQNQQQIGGGNHRRTSSSSSHGSQRLAGFPVQQQQRMSSMSSSHGGMVQDHGGVLSASQSSAIPPVSQNSTVGSSMPPSQERRSSTVNVEPISLASLLGGAQDRRGSTGSQASQTYGGPNMLSQQQVEVLQQQQQHLMSALLPPEQDTTQSQQVLSNPQLTTEDGSQVCPLPAADRIRRESSVDSGTTVRRGNRSSPPTNVAAVPHSTSNNTSTKGQAYMEGSFEGGWQSNADLPERREVIFSIVKLVEQMQPESHASKKLPAMAKRIEEHLYRTARSKEEYLDVRTLKRRLQNVAHGLDLNRSSSGGQLPLPISTGQTQSVQDDAELTEVERRTKALRQQLEQMQKLHKLEQQGGTDRHGNSQLPSGQQQRSLVAAMPPSEQTRGSTQAAAGAHPGILKATSKYDDPSVAHRNKVIKQQQQRLLLLRHASKCKAGATCKTKFCGQMVALWKHMKKCRDRNCTTSHCLSSRCVLNHYRMCKSENRTMTCEVCAPVMHQIKMQQSSQAAERRARPTEDSQADLVGRNSRDSSSPHGIDSQKQLEEIEARQNKLREQHMLLKQLKQQQAQIVEQQNQIRQQQRQAQPQSEQAIQLEQQQGLLQQLKEVFQEQQSLLQEDPVAGQSYGRASTLSPVDTSIESPFGAENTSESWQTSPQRQYSPPGRRMSMRGRGSGKILRAIEPLLGSRDSVSSLRKRSVDHLTVDPAIYPSEDKRPAKVARMNDAVPQQKVLEQGDAVHTTSLIQSMPIDAVERHLSSLNNKIHITPQTLSQRCLPIVRKLIDDQFGWIFRDPVDPVALGLPDYFDIVKNPMHLHLVEAKLLKTEYSDMDSFARDVRLVFENAILYNGDDSEVGESASIMLHRFDRDFKSVLKDINHDQSSLKHGDDSCILCGSYRRLFEPTTLYCNGACGMQRIRRNATYFTDDTKQNHWCASCYASLDDEEPILLEDGSEARKSALQKYKNDALPEEAWVQCDECSSWCHQICALFNGRKNKNAAAYRCPKCHIKKERQGGLSGTGKGVKVAKNLPHCKMSKTIEDGLLKALASAYEERALDLGVDVSEVEKADDLFVRVVSNMDKKHVVRDEMHKRYAKDGSASEFPVRSKCIALFQTIDGVDVILFAMYVYEYGDSCPAPNRRRVYVSYLDSVQYFHPKCYRTIAYHSLIIEYLRYVKERGFHTAHIWSCPPSDGDEYIFYSHPKEQLVPREDMLLHWYHHMLEKAKDDGIVLETLTLYEEYFANNGMDSPSGSAVNPTCLPYFEGDYIPGEIENIIKDIGDEDHCTKPKSVAQDAVMVRLGKALYNMRQNFMVVRLRSKDFVAAVENGEDVTDWIDVEGDSGQFSTKRIKIGSKDSNCLSQLPAHRQRILAEKTAETATKSDVKSGAAVASSSAASTVRPATDIDAVPQSSPDEIVNEKPSDDATSGQVESSGMTTNTPSIKCEDDADSSAETAESDSDPQSNEEVGAEGKPILSSTMLSEEKSPNVDELGQSKEKSRTTKRTKRTFDEIEPLLSSHFASAKSKPVGSTIDEDEPQETEMFESRQQLLNYCQANHFQFDELRRAKHSTMMILFQLHNPSAPMFLQQCGACYRDITHGTRYHCRDCSNFDLCQDCYEPVTTGLWAKRDSRFTHNKHHTFVAIDMEAPADTEKSRDERSRTIKLHLELLSHAATCHGPPGCSLNNCQRMKKLFEHVESCEVTYRKGCKICLRLLSLLTIHARMCTVRGSCPLPFCDRIRERNKRRRQQQQLMDDRRRQAQNELYRREAPA